MRPEEFQERFSVSRETITRLIAYEALLIKWQKAINLVSDTTLDDIWGRHFADSAQLAQYIPMRARVADLGSGAGFPGMVLGFLRLDLQISLIESDERKFQFLRTVSRETSIEIDTHNVRVEEILPGLKPDVITARAFAPLVELLGYAAPLLRDLPDLRFVLLKGRKAADEIEAAQEAFTFELSEHPSITDPEAAILILDKVQQKSASKVSTRKK